jgi:myo-inositol 2-dehydrogenase / D-chiro-inositol 1-dehydrogenase
MSQLRLAIIGCGNWSSRMHLPALVRLAKTQDVCYVGVCDLDKDKAAHYAGQLPGAAAVHESVDRVIEDVKPDGVLVLVPPAVAATVIEQVARHRIAFLTEKPPAPDTATHRRLIEQVGDLTHVVAYNRRHAPYIRQARQWMEQVRIQLVTVLFSRYQRREPDFTTTAVHAIDTAWYLAGGDVATLRIEAARAGAAISYFVSGWTKKGVRIDILMTPDTASAVEHYAIRGAERTVFVSCPQPSMMDLPGFVERHEANQVVSRKSAGDFDIDPTDFPALGGIVDEQVSFCQALRGTGTPLCTLASTLQTQQIREALSQLLGQGGRGTIDLDLTR